jgi:putative transposase
VQDAEQLAYEALDALVAAREAVPVDQILPDANRVPVPRQFQLDHLPEEQKEQVKSLMRAAWKMDAKTGMARIRKLAEWLEREYPSAAASLREGLEECFTINRLGVPPSLERCLATTNIIESPHAGVRIRTRRVCHWQNGAMVRRWMASAFLRTEKRFNKIMGYRDLWALESILYGSQPAARQEVA